VIVAVVDVGAIRVHQAHFESFPSRLRRVLTRHILRASRFVKDPRLALHTEVLAQLVEPTQYRRVTGEGSEADLIEWLHEAQNFKSLILGK